LIREEKLIVKDKEYIGKVIKSMEIQSRGRYEGCEGIITFTDGTVLELSGQTYVDTSAED